VGWDEAALEALADEYGGSHGDEGFRPVRQKKRRP